MFQDHELKRNFEIFHLGRVLGCQEATLIAKKTNTNKKNECWGGEHENVGRNLSNLGLRSSPRSYKFLSAGPKNCRCFSLKNEEKQRTL